MRRGCASASCRPAIRLLKTGRAAMPPTTPSTPADASRLAPSWRAPGKVMSAIAMPAISTTTMALRESTRVCVSMRRAWRLSSTEVGLRSMTPSARPDRVERTSQVTPAISASDVRWRTRPICARVSGAAPHTAASASSGRVSAPARSVWSSMRSGTTSCRTTRRTNARVTLCTTIAPRAATRATISAKVQVGSFAKSFSMADLCVLCRPLVEVGAGLHGGLDQRRRVLAQVGLFAGRGELAVLAQDFHQLAVDLGIARHALALLQEIRFPREVADQAAGLGDQQRARGHVPRRQAGFEETFGEAGRHVGEVQRRRARTAQAGGALHDVGHHAQVDVEVVARAKRESGGDQRLLQLDALAHADAAVVEVGAAAARGGEEVVAGGIVDHGLFDPSLHEQRDADAV